MLGLRLGVQSGMAGAGSAVSIPSFSRDFVTVKNLNHGIGPDITYTRTGGSASYFDSSGVIQFVSAGTGAEYARFDHDPSTLASKGLLIEEGRTNSLPNSQMSGAITGSAGTNPTGWGMSGSVSGLTRTLTTGSVNGFNYIDVRFNGTVTGGPINLTLDPQSTTAGYTASSGQTWSGSVYLALTNGTIPSGATVDVIVRGRKTDNTGSNDQSTSGNQLFLTSSLTRYSTTRTFNSADTAKVTLDIRVNTIPDATAVDLTLRIAAPQLEQGAFATSYIPTTSAAVTRGADSAVVTPITSFYNQNEGTLFAEAIASTTNGVASGIHQQTALQLLEDNVGDKLIAIYRPNGTTTGGFFVGIGTTQANITQAGFTAGANTRLIAAYKENDFALSVNGASAGTDTSGSLPTATTLRIGRYGSSSGYLNGHIRKIAYYPKRLSNERLRSLTV